ncbi:MAG TPA: BTAD domain-containing putative transcriptional regulator [Streptosporangiaceae bacterium]|nr:BTAD domain-containing putative transcriptional regulator [Streptosporangiaceae bacterium]
MSLFGVPSVSVDGERLDVPEGSKRLLAFVCLCGGRIERRRAAGVLWPDGGDVRAAGNLRSALWRLKGCGIDVVESDKVLLWLHQDAVVDVAVMQGWATRLIAGHPEPGDLDVRCWHADHLELLPGWYDDWALFERERLRQLLLHALEAMARQLIIRDRAAEAVTVALTAVAAEPLRESAQRVLVDSHLAEGNLCEARRAYEAYRVLARRELGVEPGWSLRRSATAWAG